MSGHSCAYPDTAQVPDAAGTAPVGPNEEIGVEVSGYFSANTTYSANQYLSQTPVLWYTNQEGVLTPTPRQAMRIWPSQPFSGSSSPLLTFRAYPDMPRQPRGRCSDALLVLGVEHRAHRPCQPLRTVRAQCCPCGILCRLHTQHYGLGRRERNGQCAGNRPSRAQVSRAILISANGRKPFTHGQPAVSEHSGFWLGLDTMPVWSILCASMITENQKQQLLSAIRTGSPVKAAAKAADIPRSSLYAALRRDPEFTAALAEARQAAEYEPPDDAELTPYDSEDPLSRDQVGAFCRALNKTGSIYQAAESGRVDMFPRRVALRDIVPEARRLLRQSLQLMRDTPTPSATQSIEQQALDGWLAGKEWGDQVLDEMALSKLSRRALVDFRRHQHRRQSAAERTANDPADAGE